MFQSLQTYILILPALWYAPPVTVHQVCEPLPLRGCGKFALHSKFAGLYGFACVRFLILYTYPYMPRTETSPEAMVDFVPSGSVTRRAASESMASAWA